MARQDCNKLASQKWLVKASTYVLDVQMSPLNYFHGVDIIISGTNNIAIMIFLTLPSRVILHAKITISRNFLLRQKPVMTLSFVRTTGLYIMTLQPKQIVYPLFLHKKLTHKCTNQQVFGGHKPYDNSLFSLLIRWPGHHKLNEEVKN